MRFFKGCIVITALSVCTFQVAFAQDAPTPSPSAQSSPQMSGMRDMGTMGSIPGMADVPSKSNASGMSGMSPMQMNMSSSVDLLSPMSAEASGTAWLPSSSPMYGKMIMEPDGDTLMLHGAIMPRYTDTGSNRGDRRVDAPNWFMGMFSHPLDPNSQLGLRAMISLDPLTEGGYGYPLLFQTGETWHNDPLHDRQHPHDLFSELSVDYSRRLRSDLSSYVYLGYPGEPALGPPTYMHRLIAYDLADAPIGHHWQDSTHITFGVATAGLNFGNHVKIEASDFTGREPDQNRYNFERMRFDSYSGRVSYNPDAHNSFQVSYGFLNNPDGNGVPQRRTTASWIYEKPLGPQGNFTTTLVWGQDDEPIYAGTSSSYLAEADYQRGRYSYFTRLETIEKSAEDLVLSDPPYSGLYSLQAYTVGAIYDFEHGRGIDIGFGGAITANGKPESLNGVYGSGTPVGFQVMFRLRPSRSKRGEMTVISGQSGMAANPAEAGNGTVSATIAPNPPIARQPAHLTIVVRDAAGKPITGAATVAEANMTTMDMETLRPTLTATGEGTYAGDLTFTMPGTWRVMVTVPASTTTPEHVAITRTFDFEVAPSK